AGHIVDLERRRIYVSDRIIESVIASWRCVHICCVIQLNLIIGFTFFAVFRLNEYLTLERISIQLDAGYQIVFIDPLIRQTPDVGSIGGSYF
ncbi:hypothetical protein EXA21_14945, partial [Vibrio cincinnatiensis]|nr:hypothetical protein [Vibrio cincinnatiensis]MCG3764101.1 hypothetical protein [Vibrio cincinnatiensis]